MGWFLKKKKSEHSHAMDKFILEQRQLEEKIFSAFPLGGDFDYMGVTCKVTQHRRYSRAHINTGFPSWPGHDAQVRCDYIDKIGVVHSITFDLNELERKL